MLRRQPRHRRLGTHLAASLAAFALATLPACSRGMPSTLVTEGWNEAGMDAAISRARAEVGTFIRELEAGGAGAFSVKAPITHDGFTEHFWITGVVYRNGEFIGRIGNEPGRVTNVTFGQEWRIGREDISDWMIVDGDRIRGAYTIDPLLPTMDPAEAAQLRARLVR